MQCSALNLCYRDRAGETACATGYFSLAGGGSAVFTTDVGFDFLIRKNEAILCWIVRSCGFVGGVWSSILQFLVEFMKACGLDFLDAFFFAAC